MLGFEQVVVHCVPFPSSLTGAEQEINRLLGVVWRNMSKKKNPTGSRQRTRLSCPLDSEGLGPPPLSTWLGTRGLLQCHAALTTRRFCSVGSQTHATPGLACWGMSCRSPVTQVHKGTVSGAEPVAECPKPSKRLPLLLRSKDCENCHVLLHL